MLIVSLVMNYGLAGADDYVKMMLRYLQLIVHLQLIGIPIPGLVMKSNSAWVQIAYFDVLSEDGICSACEMDQYFEFDYERDKIISSTIPAQFQTLWYTSSNYLSNTGSFGLVLTLYFVKIILISMLSSLTQF